MPRQDRDVAAWLRELGLERYAPAFLDAEITPEALPELTDADLRELGLPLGPRKVLLKAIRALAGPPPPPVGIKEEAAPWRAPTAPSQAERRQLTVMFVDLVGSTALSTRLDPEEMREVIQAYQTTVAAEITRLDGHVAKFMGDGVLAYFGWPVAHEDEPERAVRAGLAATAAVARLTAPGGEPLAARVGIATGLVVVGDLIGEGAAQEEAVVGETPNLAARLQALAEPGAVVVAGATRRLLGQLFDFADLGARELPGLCRPGRGVSGDRRADSREPVRGPPIGSAAAHGWARPGTGPRPRALAASRGRRGPGSAPGRRGRDRQVPAGQGRARRARGRGATLCPATSARPTTPARHSGRWPSTSRVAAGLTIGQEERREARQARGAAAAGRGRGRRGGAADRGAARN